MKRIRVTSKNRISMVVTYDKGVIRLFKYGDKEPFAFAGTEEEFDNEWSNPEFYTDDNEIYER